MFIRTDRLTQAMQNAGLSTSALARKVGVTPPAVSLILKGRTKRTRLAREIARALNVSEDWLFGLSDEPVYGFDGIEAMRRRFATQSSQEDFHNFEPLPLSIAYTFPQEFSERLASRFDGFAFFSIENDAMAPTLVRGDDVLVGQADVFDDPEAIWLLAYGDFVMFRRLLRTPSNAIRIIADSPTATTWEARHEEIVVGGKVVWIGRQVC